MQYSKEEQFKQWVKDYSDLLYQYTIKRQHSTELAKDLVQETFLAAWRNMDQYKGTASVKNWLFIILKSKITDHYRKASTRAEVDIIVQAHNDGTYFDSEDHWAEGAWPKGWNVNFENRAEVKEFYSVFENCGKKLKEIQNHVFVMKYVDGLESEEICKELGITSSNYWVLIHRAKVQLRSCLQKNWMDK